MTDSCPWGLKLKISGSILHDYKFQLENGDYSFVNRRFIDSEGSLGMQTLSVYSTVPKFMVIGAPYVASELITVPSPRTIAPITKTQFLLAHDLCVNIDSGEITPVAAMTMAPWKEISGSNGMIYANHIPGVFTTTKDGVISSINGSWNASMNTFTGSVEIISQAELIEVKNAIITG